MATAAQADTYDYIVVGAGSAGCVLANRLTASGQHRVLLLDHADQAGAKILISGGGRCNFTNTGASPANYLSDNPHFCRSALARYTPRDFIALVERHRGTGGVTNGFVSGFGYDRPCAVASTVAHDSHHMIVVGTDKACMARAANRLHEVGGGIVVIAADAQGGEPRELALVELPIAGLMSDRPAEVVAVQADRLTQAMRDCGCTLNNAYMQHSLLALVVIPELRISDLGLVDVTRFALTEVVAG